MKIEVRIVITSGLGKEAWTGLQGKFQVITMFYIYICVVFQVHRHMQKFINLYR